MHLSCSPNFLCASYLDECMLTYEPIVNYEYRNLSFLSFGPGRQMCTVPCCCMNVHATKLSANPLIKDAYVVLIIFLSQEGKLTCQTFFLFILDELKPCGLIIPIFFVLVMVIMLCLGAFTVSKNQSGKKSKVIRSLCIFLKLNVHFYKKIT